MSEKVIKASLARDRLGQLVDEAFYQGNDFIIEKGNRQMAAIISIEEYKRMKRQREEAFDRILKIRGKLSNEDPEKLELDITEAVNEVRAAKRKREQL